MAQAVLYVELVPTTTGIKKNVEKELNGTFDTVDKKGSSVFSKIGGLAKGAAIAAAAAAATLTGIAIKGGFSRMLKIEDAQAKLAGLGHDAQMVEKIMGSALAAVKGTAYGLDTAATIAASAVAAGIKPGQELENYLRLTADAATIAGISMEEMGSIMNKVNANGKAMTDNLNQLSDRGIPILQWLAEEYGVSTEAMSKMVSQGEVDAETFNRVLQENIGGAALKSGETTRGAFANMMAALSRVGVALIENVFPYFKTTFNNITGLLDGLTDRIKPLGAAVNEAVSLFASGVSMSANTRAEFEGDMDGLVAAGARLREFFDGFGDLWAGLTLSPSDAAAIGAPLEGMVALGAGMRSAFDGVWGALEPLIPQVLDLWTAFSPLALVLDLLGPALGSVASAVGGVLAGAITAVLPFIMELATMFGELLADALPMLIPLITELGAFVGELAAALLPLVSAVLSALMPAFAALIPIVLAIIGAVLPLVSVILDALMPIILAIIPVVLSLVDAFMPLVMMLLDLLVPVLEVVGAILGAVLPPIIGIIVGIIQLLAAVITWLVENVVVPLIEGVFIPIFEGLGAAINWVWENVLKPVFDFIGFAVENAGAIFELVFGQLGGFFEGIWAGIELGFKAFINFIIDGINGFIGGLNEVGNFISDITGGSVDIKIGKLPRLANGALVEASFGGSAAIIGEGRYDEAVLPLGGPQLEKIRDALAGTSAPASGAGAQIHVHTQPGMSEEAIGRVAAAELNWELRRA